VVLSIRHGVVHPTINLDNPSPECDLDYVPHRAREVRVTKAISNSFGFGGHNCCLVVGRFKLPSCRERPPWCSGFARRNATEGVPYRSNESRSMKPVAERDGGATAGTSSCPRSASRGSSVSRPAACCSSEPAGWGSPLALYLAAAGVGRIGIVDFDVVDFSNLQRQILHGTADVGRPSCTPHAIASRPSTPRCASISTRRASPR